MKLSRLFLPASVVLALVMGLGTSFRLFRAQAASLETGNRCGGGSFKEDNWSDGETERSRSWADTPGFNCTHGVANAQVEIKAGQSEGGPDACSGFEWDENGWRVFEKWQTEEEKNENNCQDISNAVITWTCNCPPPTATLTATDPFTATPTETETPTDTATPTKGPSPTPTDTPTITNTPTEGPSPTPTETDRPQATATNKPGGSGGGEGPSDGNSNMWLIVAIATGVTFLGYIGARKLLVKASLL